MKHILLMLVAVLFALPAFAQLEQGQHMIGGSLSLGFQLNNAGISYSDHGGSVDWGTLGGGFCPVLLLPSRSAYRYRGGNCPWRFCR